MSQPAHRRPGLPLLDKVALITGASGGIGGMIARALGAAGALLVLTGRTNTRLRRAAEQVHLAGVPEERVLAIAADLSDAEAASKVVAAATDHFGRLDILVNSAGVGIFKSFEELSIAELDEVLDANLKTALYTTRHACDALIAARGHVVNITSGLGKRGASKATAYAAAHFALRGFSESLRLDMARHDVRVSCVNVAGAGVATDFWTRADPSAKRMAMLVPERIAEAVLVVLTMRGQALVDDVTVRTR